MTTPRLTFLGHQGWAFETQRGVVLLDPLQEAMGNGPRRLPVWPERRLQFDQLNTISGLVISHEHSDHFDLRTLYELPYRGVVYIPDLSSEAMARALCALGFEVRRLRAFEEVAFPNGLRLMPLPIVENIFERDVYAMLVRTSDWSFLTPVDGLLSPESTAWLAAHCPERSIDNYTNNATEMLPHLHGGPSWARYALGRAATALIDYVEQTSPSNVVVSGQGWCFTAPHERLNSMFFPVTGEAVADVGRRLYPFIAWTVASPGQQFPPNSDGGLAGFVARRPTRDRSFNADAVWEGRLVPWSGERDLNAEAMRELEAFLHEEYGELLSVHAANLLEALAAIDANGGELRPTVGLRILNGGRARHYTLSGSRFMPDVDERNFRTSTACGIEIWASDLLLLARGEEEAFLVYESSVRRWNNVEHLYEAPIVLELFAGLCPHARPAAYLDAYRRRLKELAGPPC